MALYAIGDIQGCFQALLALLEKINFIESDDEIWFCGDLVNRGRQSLEVLRFVRNLGCKATTVLGNHDLHLLAVASGQKPQGKHDTLDEILSAPDAKQLIDWLSNQPLTVNHPTKPYFMVHAGVFPEWTLAEASQYSAEVEWQLRSENQGAFLSNMYGNRPTKWSNELTLLERQRFITNSMTRMRYVDKHNALDMKQNGAPGTQPDGLLPWFEKANRQWEKKIVFGHWSTLGILQTKQVIALDGGCLWGGRLAAARLGDTGVDIVSLRCEQQQKPR